MGTYVAPAAANRPSRLLAGFIAVALIGALGLGVALGTRAISLDWLMAEDSSQVGSKLIVEGSTIGAIRYTGIPYPAPGGAQDLIVEGSTIGAIRYTGIPYPAPGGAQDLMADGIRYTGIPYPAPGPR